MFLYVANGVMTIRGMLGAPKQLLLREQLARGEIVGPTLFVGAESVLEDLLGAARDRGGGGNAGAT